MSDIVSSRRDAFNDIIRSRVKQALRVAPAERLLAGLEHSDLSMKVVEDGIRHQYPEADDATVGQLLMERIALMRRLEERR